MKHPTSSNSRYAWLIVGLLWVVVMLNYLDRILITSMRDPIVKDFSLTDAQFGLLTSVFLWSYGVLSPFGGYFADKYSRKRAIVFSALIWSAVTLWTGFAHSFPELLVARIFMGISESFYLPAGMALITDYHRDRTRSLATGIHMSGLSIGLALGGMGGFIAESWGWRYGFQAFGTFGVLYSVFLMVLLKDKKDGENEHPSTNPESSRSDVSVLESLRMLLGVPSFNIFLIFFCIYGMANWLVFGWLPKYLKDQFHLNLGEAGISATGYIQIGGLVGLILGGILADRWAQKNIRARLYMIIIGFTIGAPFLFIMASTNHLAWAIIGIAFYGLARGFHDSNLMPVICQIVDGRYIATGFGFMNLLSTIVGGGMVYLGGVVLDAKIAFSLLYQIIAIMLLLAAWSLFGLRIKGEN